MLAARLSQDTEHQLEQMRTAWREGRRQEAHGWLQQIKHDQTAWSWLAATAKAKLLRFEARIELDVASDLRRATQLLDEAHQLAPNDPDRWLRALIAYHEHGPETALTLVADATDVESQNMYAGILLELGRIAECQNVLIALDATLSPNAETLRLRALLGLVMKDVSQAQLAAKKALELGPTWVVLQFTSAVVDYFSAIVPAAWPERVLLTPEPVEWIVIRRDDTSLERLSAAAHTFGRLADTTADAPDRQRYLLWQMASLANHPDRQDDAVALCHAILADESSNYSAFIWAVARNFALDLAPSDHAFTMRVRTKQASLTDVLALVQYRATQGRTKQALRLLEHTRALFEQQQMVHVWHGWNTQIQLLQGKREVIATALAAAEGTEDMLRQKTLALRIVAQRSGEWQPLLDHLEQRYVNTGDSRYLIERCELLAFQEQWSAVANHAEQLVTTIGTAEAVRIAVLGTFNAGHFADCLHLLDMHRDAFQHQRFPHQLRYIRMLCLRQLGAVSEARAEAEALAHEQPTTDHILALINIHIEHGDFMRAAVAARQLHNRPEIPVDQALRLARLTRHDDLRLAQNFWRQATRQGLPDELVGSAQMLGTQLGLDAEMRELTVRMMELGHSGRAGIQMFSIADLLQFVQQRQDHAAELHEAYRSGSMPIHLIADLLNISLIDIYHRALTTKQHALRPRPTFPLLARHGGRMLPPGFPESVPAWRLHLDVTALLLAAHLDVLDAIERAFAPLRIPAELIPALIAMREDIAHHQPSQLQACRHILRLASTGRVHVVHINHQDDPLDADLVEQLGETRAALIAQARDRGGYVVDFLPLTRPDLTMTPVILPHAIAHTVTNCRAVIESLQRHGHLSDQSCAAAIAALGREGQHITDAVLPTPGTFLRCHAGILDLLSHAGVLDIVTTHFQVYVEQHELDSATATLAYQEQRQEDSDWLEALIDRIRLGLEAGTYQRIPVTKVGKEDAEPDDPPVLRCLLSLFTCDVQSGDALWIDDRFTNGYIQRDAVPIIGISDVLTATVSAGTLTRDQYYTALHRLRASDVRFIPVTCDEIMHALLQARIDEQGRIIEHDHLRSIRRYVARCLLQGSMLQWPPLPDHTPMPPNPEGEVAFVVSLQRAIDEAIVQVWEGTDAEQVCRARANWLRSYLMFDSLMARTVIGLPSADEHTLVATHLAALLVHLPINQADMTQQLSMQRAYQNWLDQAVMHPRLAAEPLLVAALADIMKVLIIDVLDTQIDADSAPLATALFQLRHTELPDAVREEIERDTTFMARLGLHQRLSVPFDDLLFDLAPFWHAAEAAINGQAASLTPRDHADAIVFEPVLEGATDPTFTYKHPSTGTRHIVDDRIFHLLLRSVAQREEILRNHRLWFDCDNTLFERLVADIATQSDPQQRVEEAMRWRSESVAWYYTALAHQLQTAQAFTLDDLLPPSADGLLRHFRIVLPPESQITMLDVLEHAAQTLMHEEGVVQTFDRLARFPLPLPMTVLNMVAAAPPGEQRAMVKDVLRCGDSPLFSIHLIRLLIHLGAQTPSYNRLARRLIQRLIRVANSDNFSAFFALLNWMDAEFNQWEAAQSWPSSLRLSFVWAHADKIFRILRNAGVSLDRMHTTFQHSRIPRDLFTRDGQVQYEASHPRRMQPLTLLFAGLAYSVPSASRLLTSNIQEQLAQLTLTNLEDSSIPTLALLGDAV